MKRIKAHDDRIIEEIKRLIETKDILPNSITKYHGYFLEGDSFFFVTDAYESSNMQILIEKLKRKGQMVSATKAIDFAIQILDGLAFIHSRRIIHRDIRPK